jgi:predicted dehydrogenase
MAPIRVGLVGLSGAPPDQYEGVSWTPNAHLPYLKASPNYEIIALLNTSIASGNAVIERYNLPPETKAYENPEGMFPMHSTLKNPSTRSNNSRN